MRTSVAYLEGVLFIVSPVFLDLRMVFFRTGCVKRRSTETVTVWSLASRGHGALQNTFGHRILRLLLFGRRFSGFFVQDGFHTGSVAAGRFDAVQCFPELTGCLLKAQVKALFLEVGPVHPEAGHRASCHAVHWAFIAFSFCSKHQKAPFAGHL